MAAPGSRAYGHAVTPYGLVEATPRFVAERLEALSAALLLPRPTRDGFLFDASPRFYAACTDSVVSLQRATKRIIQHLGLPCETVVVCFSSSFGAAARIESEGGSFFVEIDARYRSDAHALGAVLAHECCHILVASRRVRRLDNALDEVHVDLAAALAGLGTLTLNGIVDRSDAQVAYEHRSLGYLRADMLECAVGIVAARLGLGADQALRNLHNPIVRRGLASALRRERMRLKLGRSAPLSFGPARPHEVVPCPGASDAPCEERLRIPAGKRGTARCPTCKAQRSFDGTPLDARELDAPVPLEDAIPPRVHFGAFRARWRGVPAVQKLGLAIAVGFLPAVLGVRALDRLSLGKVGDTCTQDDHCRSGQCLRVSHRPASPGMPRASLGDPGLDRMLDDAVGAAVERTDPLSPTRDDPRFVRTDEAYCTETCSSDRDCPSGFVCAETRSYGVGYLGPSFIQGRGVAGRSCAKR